MALQLLDSESHFEVKDSELPDVFDGDQDVVYVLRQIAPALARELALKYTTRPVNRRTGARETDVDQSAVMDDLVDYALVDWRGLLLRGEPAPCTREHKLLLDFPRRSALLAAAGLNRTAPEDREQSFRKPHSVVRVLG